MTHPNRNLGALIGSRICHDLISPVGAISNGLELLGLSGVPDGPEMALVADSAAHANARLRFFRVAFGLSSDTQSMAEREMRGVVADIFAARLRCDWQISGPLPRRTAQAVFLALLCCEQAAPFGGTITVSGTDDALHITLNGDRLATEGDHWGWLTGAAHGGLDDLPASHVQFALLPDLLTDLGRPAQVSLGGDAVTLTF